MSKARKLFFTAILTVLAALTFLLGMVFSMPAKTVSAATLPATNWTLAREGDNQFRIQNGNTYWNTYTNNVTTESMLDYTEINGKTMSEINAEKPGALTVTLQPAGGSIGSFYRVNINTEIAGFTTNDVGTFVIRSGWSHKDTNGTYTINTDLYFAHAQNKWASDSNNWKYIPKENVVDISEAIQLQDQGIQMGGTRAILIKTSNNTYWTADPLTPNEGGASFLNMLYVNGTSVKAWNKQAHAALNAGEITDITFGAEHGVIKNNKGDYAPIFVSNSGYTNGLGSIAQVWIPTGYIPNVSAFKVAKGFANLQGNTLYYVSKDVEYVKSGSEFVKIASSVDISDKFKIVAQDYTSSNGTTLYYLHTNNVQYWSQQYGSTGAFAINEKEWKGVSDSALQGGAVQMSYIEFNGTPIYDINAGDNGAYGATQGNIAGGGKYAPILAFLTPQELGNAIKLQVPTKYPSGAGTAKDNHKTIVIKKGFYVVDTSTSIKYEVTKDIQWDYADGVWGEHTEKIETSVIDAKMFGDANDAFAGIKLEGSDYAGAPALYAGDAQKAITFAQSANFLSHILIDGQSLSKPGEAYLNVWSKFGYFTFRPGKNTATSITILAGCQFPTYNALRTGAKEVYVTTEDVTFVKDSSGNWVLEKGSIAEGEYETSVKSVTYARDNQNNWMMFSLSEKDYPNPSEVYNVQTTEGQISALNLYDKIVVDGFTLRHRINTYGNPQETPKINLWVADCFALRVSGCEGALNGAQKVTIRAGAQFPSYAYITEGVKAYFVTAEEMTFVNVGAGSGVWERQYHAIFKADGEVTDVIEYVPSKGLTPPEVPEKEGYIGAWEHYNANGNITVNAVYTKKPMALGKTGIKELRRIDNNSNLLIINPTNSDYPASVDGSWNIGLDVSHLQKFNLLDYITINGKTLREIGVSSMAINKFTRAGLGLETKLSNAMTIVIKKGCELPSYTFWKNPTGESSCYVVDADYTCVYNAGGETAFAITSENADLDISNFADHYILSDLHKVGYGKTNVFKDGAESWTNEEGEASYRYGYVDSTSFTLSFDFKYEGATFYENLNINLGVEGYGGNKYHFGWRLYLLRGSAEAVAPNCCVEYFSNTSTYAGNIPGSADKVLGTTALEEGKTYRITIGYRLVNAATGEVEVFTALNSFSRMDTYVLGGDFVSFASGLNSLTMNAITKGTVVVSDPGKMSAVESGLHRVQFFHENTLVIEGDETSVVLPDLNPTEYGKAGCVFVGWTTDPAKLSDLYPAGYEMTLTANTKLHAVWIRFALLDGASVCIVKNTSGIRFTTIVDGDGYDAGKAMGLIAEIGTLVAPTEYLYIREFTHSGLGEGYYAERKMETWRDDMGDTRAYSAAFVNISYDQYSKAFSARGYMKVNYTTGEGYIYTAYDAKNHSRSIYQVATLAYKDYENTHAIQDYVNSVADIAVDKGGVIGKQESAKGGYTLAKVAKDGKTVTITLSSAVKAVTLNGTPLVMGYASKVLVGTNEYLVENYVLSSDGLTVSFDLDLNMPAKELGNDYYFNLISAYGKRNDYNAENKALVEEIVAMSNKEDWANGDGFALYQRYMNDVKDGYGLAEVKTATQMSFHVTSKGTLTAPILRNGLGYTVVWDAVENADYYYIYDSNDNDLYTVVMAGDELSYKAEVVGNHSIYVVAHSYYTAWNSSAQSNAVTTPEVKPVFSYKSMIDGLYKFSSSQMKTMGISTSGCYYDSSDKKYFVYYNAKTGWSPYESKATDWTSPENFPAHAQRLKAMGNNIIMVARDSNAEYEASATSFESSRLRSVMDTAWSMGMKVLVCDEVFYKLSMSDGSGTGATSLAQVQTAIKNRVGFAEYVTHPAFYGFSLDDEPYGKYINAMSYTISALNTACENLGVENPFFLACLFQAQGGELGKEWYLTQSSLEEYYNKWLAIDGIDSEYLYVDIYTQHAMAQPTDRYNTSFEVVYDEDYLGGKYKFHQALTAHTQNNGVLLEQDLYMSLLYAAAHNVAGYSWFCYFPIAGELSGSMAGYDGNGYGNGMGNGASGCYYNAAKTAGYQFELIQGWLNGYEWKTRKLDGNLLTTTLSNGGKTATMYVNADVTKVSRTVSCTASGSVCYLVGYGVGTEETPYTVVSGNVTLQPGQAVICIS